MNSLEDGLDKKGVTSSIIPWSARQELVKYEYRGVLRDKNHDVKTLI